MLLNDASIGWILLRINFDVQREWFLMDTPANDRRYPTFYGC